jgi:hypothetical protein
MLGLDPRTCVWIGDGAVSCSSVLIPVGARGTGANLIGQFTFPDPDDLASLRQTLLASLPGSSGWLGKRIVIDRSDGWRPERVAGFANVIQDLVRSHGFVAVRLSEIEPKEQLLLFRDGKVIVGEHGAGLSSMICASGSTAIIEVLPASNRAAAIYSFWMLSQVLTLPLHFTVIGDGSEQLTTRILGILNRA